MSSHLTRLAWLTILVGSIAISSCGDGSQTEPDEVGFDPPGLASASDVEFCVAETNRYRQQAGRPPLTHDEILSARAQEAATSDQETGSPHGYFNAHPFAGAENEALRWTLRGSVRDTIATAIALFFSEGPGGGHYENLTGAFGRIGCGVAVSGEIVTFVQNFQ